MKSAGDAFLRRCEVAKLEKARLAAADIDEGNVHVGENFGDAPEIEEADARQRLRPFDMDFEKVAAVKERGPGLDRALLDRSEEHTSELQSRENLVCRL